MTLVIDSGVARGRTKVVPDRCCKKKNVLVNKVCRILDLQKTNSVPI